MYLLITYDVEAKRTEKFRKLLGQYLVHTQNSVFAGDLTVAKTIELRKKLSVLMIASDRVIEIATANRQNVEVNELEKSESGKGVVRRRPIDDHRRDFVVI